MSQVFKIKLTIEAVEKESLSCFLLEGDENLRLDYYPVSSKILFHEKNGLAAIVDRNKTQFEKVIRSAIKGTAVHGQTIDCVFIENFRFLDDGDFNHAIWVDRRGKKIDITTGNPVLENVFEVFSDGSHSNENNRSGYAGFIQNPDGDREVYYRSVKDGNSNLMELMAVIEGLKMIRGQEIIRLNTDSRYVIRGLAQWIHFWKHNNWQTAYGRDVKNITHWQVIDHLCEGKLIELHWIKGHSGQAEQTFCHELARQSTTRKN